MARKKKEKAAELPEADMDAKASEPAEVSPAPEMNVTIKVESVDLKKIPSKMHKFIKGVK